MRKQIAAANWKMNCSLQDAEKLLTALSQKQFSLKENEQVVIAVPFPYLLMAKQLLNGKPSFFISAQNCHQKDSGAYTGEVSAAMLASCGITHVIIGHSERRQYFNETSDILAQKTDLALQHGLTPIFCCGEDLAVREHNEQNHFVESQIRDGLFHLNTEAFSRVLIAYEPIWAIGTGKTATAAQAQEMHAHIRKIVGDKYGNEVADHTTILYGGSVKGDNANELFSQPDVDGGLVGGASLKADEFEKIIHSLS
ncbi:MAG: triose-phosphate isomerase [Chitinophagaceae bacterium]|nr:triose-phosphate isomerase [Chitinophagaceae bacterium]